tara:strand:- start:61 stop:1314 length:1254 start_codon:yes stop_codon:yes gene_type:complete
MEVSIMPAIVDIPNVVRNAADQFADLFSNNPQRQHLAEYLTGLIVARKKSVNGMNGEFAGTTDQSCWNRFLTEVEWDVQRLNERRLEILQKDPTTRYHDQGVIAIDDVLIDHDGKLIDDVGWFWDHAEDRYKFAHDYVFVNYVCGNGKHYPLECRLFKKRDQCEAAGLKFHDHGVLFRQLIDWVIEHDIPGAFTFDSYFTSADNVNYINSKKDGFDCARAYVGDLKSNRKIWYRGKEIKADALAASIGPDSRKEVRRGDKRQWYFTCTIRIPDINHKVRIVFIWDKRRDKTPRKTLITNRVTWEVTRILRVYRHRWTGTETFHRDGKQELGMGDCQLRDGQGQTRHMYLVMLAYSLLTSQLNQNRAKEWAFHRLTTIGEACRAVLNETMRTTLDWAIEQVTENSQKREHVMALLRLT